MTKNEVKKVYRKAYLDGFNATGEGYNGENPFWAGEPPEKNPIWKKTREECLEEFLKKENSNGK